MPKLRPIFLALVAVLAALPARAQSLAGRVVDAASGEGVTQATLTVLATHGRTVARGLSGPDGDFALALRNPGEYSIRVERTGYQTVTSQMIAVSPAESVKVAIRISPSAVALDPLTVVGRSGVGRIPALEATGFYAREARGFGRFYRRDFVEQRINRPLSNILDEIPGISLRRDGGNGTYYVTFDRGQANGTFQRAQQGQADRCLPVFYLDGSRVTVGPRMLTPNDLVSAAEIEAIEVYASAAHLPPEFNGSDAACGVIVIWTRRSR